MLVRDRRLCLLFGALLCTLSICPPATARIPPPRVTMDKLLARAELILVARVEPGSVRSSPSGPYREVSLRVTRVLKGRLDEEKLIVTLGSFPAREFPKSEAHPDGRFLLVGWDEDGHTGHEPRGLDLYAEQVWFVERAADPRLKAAPWMVAHNESVQDRAYVPLIHLLLNKGTAADLRLMINKAYGGVVPGLIVEALYGSGDPGAGALVWDCLRRLDAAPKTPRPSRHARSEDIPHPGTVFRTLNSLGRDEALRWARKALAANDLVIRLFACESLKMYGDTQSVPAVIKLLEAADSPEERRALMGTLGIIGDARALPVLIDRLTLPDGEWQAAQEALFRLTDIRFSPNGTSAREWCRRNKDRPRWHWLKQGIEQDLHLLGGTPTRQWRYQMEPTYHLSRVTCWRFEPRRRDAAAVAWKTWWQANKDLPQERWVLDSFRTVGRPVPDLSSHAGVEALIETLHATPGHWYDKGPVFDTYLHPAWCQRLLTQLTGLWLVDTEYGHFTDHDYFDTKVYGPKWRAAWQQNREHIKVRHIDVPAKQPFVFEEEDRKLVFADLDDVRSRVALDGPLVPNKPSGRPNADMQATFVISITNGTERALTLHAKPAVSVTIMHKGSRSGGHVGDDVACLDSKAEFVTVAAGKSARWRVSMPVAAPDANTPSHYGFHLTFERSGADGAGWRGVVDTPFVDIDASVPIKKER